MEDHESPPATLEEPFVPPAPEVEDSFSTEIPSPLGPDPVDFDAVQQVRREFAEVLESLKKERHDLQDLVEEKLQELTLEIEKLRASPQLENRKTAPETKQKSDYSKAVVAEGEVLLCSQNPALIATCEEALSRAGFLVNAATSHELAGRRIQEYAYQIIVFDQKFVVGSKEGQAVLNSVRKIALPVRRHQSVVMLSPGIPSCESQVFYQWGIDLNVHTDDLAELGGYVADLVQLKTSLLSAYLDSDLDTDRIMA